MKIKLQYPIFAILLDIDNTILNTEDWFDEGLKAVYEYITKKKLLDISFSDFKELYNEARKISKVLHKGKGVESSRLLYFKILFNNLGINIDEETLIELNTIYWDAVIEKSKAPSGLKEFLELCKRNLILVGVVTDMDIDIQIKKLKKAIGDDWKEYIDVFITSQEIGVNKDNPLIYLYAINKFGIHNPGNVLFIDDRENNLEVAKHVGLQTIHFGKDVKNFNELIEILNLEKIGGTINKNKKVVFLDIFGVIVETSSFSKLLEKYTKDQYIRHLYMLWSQGILSYKDIGITEDDFNKISKELKIRKESLEIIEKLYNKGYEIGVLSNIPLELYNSLGLPKEINKNLVIISGEYRRRKPDPVLVYMAIREAEAIPSNVYFVDDKPENLKPAKFYGAKTILYDPNNEHDGLYPWVDHKIRSLVELEEILE